jgi:dipeptidyl aminopeptidase/acylaminoacyl peptidase
VPIDMETMRVSGRAIQLTSGSATETFARCSATGQIVFTNEVQSNRIFSLRVDRNSQKAIGAPKQVIGDLSFDFARSAPRVSRDGTKLVFVSDRSGSRATWIKDLETGRETVVTTSPRPDDVPLISGDGSLLIYGSGEQGAASIYVTNPAQGFAQKACENCGTLLDWSRDGRQVLLDAPSRAAMVFWDRNSGVRREWLKHRPNTLVQASLSPDGKWVALVLVSEPRGFIAPVTATPISTEQLVPLPPDRSLSALAWSEDGNVLYYFSRLDDYRCLWAQRLDSATKRPVGSPVPVYHFHTHQLAPFRSWVSTGAGLMVFTLTEPHSSIWLAAPGLETTPHGSTLR